MLKFFTKYIKIYKWMYICFVFFGLVTSAITIIIPQISGRFIDSLINKMTVDDLVKFCVAFGGAIIINIVAGYLNNRLFVKISISAINDIKIDLLNKIRKTDMFVIKKMSIAAIAQMSDNDAQIVINNILTNSQSILVNIILEIASILIVCKINMLVALFFFAVTIAYVFIYIIFQGVIYDVNKEYLLAQTQYFEQYFEQFRKIEFIKNNVIYELFDSLLLKCYKRFHLCSLKLQKVNYSFGSLDAICMTFAQFILFYFGGREVIRNNITVGEFTILSTYFNLALVSVRYFLNLGKIKKETDVSLERLQGILNLQKETDGEIELTQIDNIKINSAQHILFDSSLINFADAYFEKNNIYLIKGKNGIGKTTLLNIISGLYKIQGLEIYVNDIKIDELNMEYNRKKHFSILEQFPCLIDMSIKENMYLDIESNDLIDNKYDKFLEVFNLNKNCNSEYSSDFGNMSGGEVKKIAIIRTFLKNSDVVILDEPTASLDESTKKIFIELLKKEKKNKIIIVVSHDDDLMCVCDQVIEM